MRRILPAVVGLACAAGFAASPAAADPLITPGAELVSIPGASLFLEGPTWDPRTQKLYFSSLSGAGQLHRLTPPTTVELWLDNTQGINGTYLANDGRLLCCQGNTRRILSYRIGADGPEDEIVLAEDASWNAPNDICQTASGDIYFTTPDFGARLTSTVYHLAPGGAVSPLVTDMTLCNGLTTSPDDQTLYVGDSYDKWWRSYPNLSGSSVGAGSVFFNPSTSNTADPDGMTTDEFGNLYFTGRGGFWIVSPAGVQLEMVPVPEFVTNLTFGGADGKTLYLTCDGKLYSLSMEVRGRLWANVPPTNQPPQVEAGVEQTITMIDPTATLDATVSDDGDPDPPGAVVTEWRQISGPGTAAFGDDTAVDTTVTFIVPGTYVLELWAYDGIVPATDEVTVHVLVPGDFDGDGDVDVTDIGQFDVCMTGANAGPVAPGCELVDVDTDGDVDMTDFGLTQRCLSGAGNPADPDCAGVIR
jgi:gluconolactonase